MTGKQRQAVVSWIKKRPEAHGQKRAESKGTQMQVLAWLVAFTLMAVANTLWLILRSFFQTILPTKKNLLTYLDEVLVISMALTCSFEVSSDKRL